MAKLLHVTQSGSGIPFIFQHGLGAQRMQPQGLLSEVSGVELISIDCPGHGESPLSADITPSFAYYADQVIHAMEELGHPSALLGGISMGAGIALHIALKHPEKVRGLVLVRPAWLDAGTPQNLAILLHAAKLIPKSNGKATFEQRADFKAINQLLPKAGQSVLGVFGDSQRPELPLVLEAMVQDRPFDSLDALAEIQLPTLIMGNDDDPLHPFAMAAAIHQAMPGSELHKVVSRYVDNDQHKLSVTQLVSTFITHL